MADHSTLGHFLPYLLRRRLRAVLWPTDGGELALVFLVAIGVLLYGLGFGYLLNSAQRSEAVRETLPQLLVGVNALLLFSTLFVDFVPMLRAVTRPVPEHFPVSARMNVVTAFLLDLLTLRRLALVAWLLVTAAVAPRHAAVPGFGLLLLLGAAALSFNLRLLLALRRWRHPLLGLHLLSLGLMVAWLAQPEAPYHAALGWGMALLPWALGVGQVYWLGPYFSARYLLAVAPAVAAPGTLLGRLSPEWKTYVLRTRAPLLMGLGFKILFIGWAGLTLGHHDPGFQRSFFYFVFLPVMGFTYINNNLFGHLGPVVANEIQRLGLTPRLLRLYARIVGPVVLADCLASAVLLLGLFPSSQWDLLGLLPLGAVAFASVGLWGSLYQAKSVPKAVNFGNMRQSASLAMTLATMLLAAVLFFVPWWWLRCLLAALVAGSAVVPVRAVLRNDGALRRRLWRGIGAWGE